MAAETTSNVPRAEKLAELEGIRELEVETGAARARLKELLRDQDEEVRAEAAAAVWHYYDDAEILAKTLELSKSDASRAVRVRATTALGRVIYEGDVAGADEPDYRPDVALGEPPAETYRKVRDYLKELARDAGRSLDERRFAVEGLGFIGTDPDVRALIDELHAMSEPQARLSAIFAMGRSGDHRFEKKILDALDSSEPKLRLQAIWAAGEAELVSATTKLAKLALDATPDQRKAAVESLGRIGGEGAAQGLLKVTEKERDPEVRQAATLALEEIALGHAADGEIPSDEDEEQDDEAE